MAQSGTAHEVEGRAANSTVLEWCVRVGMLTYGLVHLLVAFVAVRLALQGRSPGTATGGGAMAQLAGETSGRVVLLVMAASFASLVAWQVLVAAVGFRDRSRRRRLLERIGAASRAVAYGYFAFVSARLAAAGRRGSSGSPRSTAAGVLTLPAGQVLVFLAGATVAGIGIGLVVFGVRRGFLGQLEHLARRGRRRGPIVWLGMAGYLAKGAAFVVIGGFLCVTGLTRDPRRSGGIDVAFRELLGARLGTAAVLAVGAGIGCFGLYLFVVSRHLDDDSLTS